MCSQTKKLDIKLKKNTYIYETTFSVSKHIVKIRIFRVSRIYLLGEFCHLDKNVVIQWSSPQVFMVLIGTFSFAHGLTQFSVERCTCSSVVIDLSRIILGICQLRSNYLQLRYSFNYLRSFL
jgi:hypothetical protein